MDGGRRLAWGLTALLLAGCSAPDGSQGDPPTTPSPAPSGILKRDVGATDCFLSDLHLAVDRETAESRMPDAYEAGGSGAVAGMVVTVHTCASAPFAPGGFSSAELSIFLVHPELPPTVASYDGDNRTAPEDTTYSPQLYMLAAYTDSPELLAIWQADGIPAALATFEHAIDAIGTEFRAHGLVTAGGLGLQFDSLSISPGNTFQVDHVLRRQFHETADGLSLAEHDIFGTGPITGYYGPGVCAFGPGGLFAEQATAPCVMAEMQFGPAASWGWAGADYWFPDERIGAVGA